MKCANYDCLMDAKLRPRRKRGPVRDFMLQARMALGVNHATALVDEQARKKVAAMARSLAYEEIEGFGVCHDCTDWASTEIDQTDLQFIPTDS